jgi:hypothetical protein
MPEGLSTILLLEGVKSSFVGHTQKKHLAFGPPYRPIDFLKAGCSQGKGATKELISG